MRRGIVFAQVSLDLHNAGGEHLTALSPHQNFAE
jgi:hypothetical protein